jgi:membrane-bound metal-dependent hydrolase YbcI (DUF457 family)
MDIVSHAIAGASAGAVFGRPVLGAVFGVIPDVVLGITRKTAPGAAYDVTHSLLFVLAISLLCAKLDTWAPVLAVLSHIVLDLPTHGSGWAPPLLYPICQRRFSYGEEWEWFNRSWWRGLVITIIWSLSCLTISYA